MTKKHIAIKVRDEISKDEYNKLVGGLSKIRGFDFDILIDVRFQT